MERLWSPWRLAYVTASAKSEGCVFCDAQDPSERQSSLIVFQGTACFIILNLFPYNNGHLMVVPRRHIGSLAAATPEELAELMDLTRRAEIALVEAYAPHGLNMGVNLGKPAGAEFRNSWWYDVGVGQDLAGGAVNLSVFFEEYSAIVPGLDNAREVLAAVTMKGAGGWRLQVSGEFGLSDGAPDHGLTFGASRRF